MAERVTVDELHRQVMHSTHFSRIECGHNVWMHHPRCCPDFLIKTVDRTLVLHSFQWQRLDRNDSLHANVFGQVDLPHTPRADQAFDLIIPDLLGDLTSQWSPLDINSLVILIDAENVPRWSVGNRIVVRRRVSHNICGRFV